MTAYSTWVYAMKMVGVYQRTTVRLPIFIVKQQRRVTAQLSTTLLPSLSMEWEVSQTFKWALVFLPRSKYTDCWMMI